MPPNRGKRHRASSASPRGTAAAAAAAAAANGSRRNGAGKTTAITMVVSTTNTNSNGNSSSTNNNNKRAGRVSSTTRGNRHNCRNHRDPKRQRMAATIATNSNNKENAHVLDTGVGVGRNVPALSSMVADFPQDVRGSTNNSSSMTLLTPHAVRKMILAEPYTGSVVIGMHIPPALRRGPHQEEFQVCWICDNSLCISVLVCINQLSEWDLLYEYHRCFARQGESDAWLSVRVEGYITSPVNLAATVETGFLPFLCLIDLTILPTSEQPQPEQTSSSSLPPLSWKKWTCDMPNILMNTSVAGAPASSVRAAAATTEHPPSSPMTTTSSSKIKLPGGSSPSFLADHVHNNIVIKDGIQSSCLALAPEDWMGLGRVHQPQKQRPQREVEFEHNRRFVLDFWIHHNAMKTLRESKLHAHSDGATASSSPTTKESSSSSSSSSTDSTGNGSAASETSTVAQGDDTTNSNSSSDSSNNTTTVPQPDTANGESPQQQEQQQQQQQQSPTTRSQQQHHQHELYFAALREFEASQLDRQKASLTSNAGRATARDAVKVVEQHNAAFEMVMKVATELVVDRHQQEHHHHPSHLQNRQPSQSPQQPPWITVEALKHWHDILCGKGLHVRAGRFRTNVVRAGKTVFCPPHQVLPKLRDKLLPSLQSLEWSLRQSSSSSSHHQALACLTYASAVFFGLIDVHPFSDGNGRLARLISNASLRVMGLPFCINWFATPSQRRDYVLAILMTQRNLNLEFRGSSSDDDDDNAACREKALLMRSVVRAAGLFYPLVTLLMDRVRKAIPELLELQHQRQLSAMEHAEAVAARCVRERAAAGSCLICCDDHPNILTICCGKAVHLNCIAEWLSSNSSCPNCRGTLPILPKRPSKRNTSSSSSDSDDDGDSTMDFDTTSGMEDDGSTTGSLTSEEIADRIIASLREANVLHSDNDDENDTGSVSDDNTTTVVVHVHHGGNHDDDNDEDDDDDDTTDDTTTVVVANTDNANSEEEDDEEADTTSVQGEGEEEEEVDDNNSATATVEGDGGDENDTSSDPGNGDGEDAASTASNNHHQERLPIVRCRTCRNRAAQECTNECCGKCCLTLGEWECPRHTH